MMTPLHEWPALGANFEIPMRYLRRDGAGTPGVVICLHGYQDHAASMVRRLGWAERGDLPFTLLAVNAPFPVPLRTANKFTEAYAWYFNDATRGIAVGSPAVAADAIAAILRRENLTLSPSVILGFSQGGLVAPALARHGSATRAIIGVGTGYSAEAYRDLAAIEVHGLHGVDDTTWPIADARAAHERLGRAGGFTAIPNLEHRLTPALGDQVVAIASKLLV